MVALSREKKKIKTNDLTIFYLGCFQKNPMRMGGVEAREARLLLISLFGLAPSSLRFIFPLPSSGGGGRGNHVLRICFVLGPAMRLVCELPHLLYQL